MLNIWRSTEGLFRRLRRVFHLLRRGNRPRERLYPIRHRRDASFTSRFPRSDDSRCMENFPKPSRAQLDAAFPYECLTVTGKIDDPLWDPCWRQLLALDDDAHGDTVMMARDLAHKRREATALAAVRAWNKDNTQPAPVLSVLEGNSRRCALVAVVHIRDGRSGGKKRAWDCSVLEPLSDAVAAAGGLLVAMAETHRDGDLDLVLVSPHIDVESLGNTSAASTSLKERGRIVYCNGKNCVWAALAEEGDDDDDDDADDEAPSIANRPRRGGAAAVPVAPPKPVKSPEEIAAAPCFMLDALTRGRPVLDDDAAPFRAHYSCFERTRTDPEDTRIIRIRKDGAQVSTGKTARQYFGEFYPTSGFGKWNPGFSPKDPPESSYAA